MAEAGAVAVRYWLNDVREKAFPRVPFSVDAVGTMATICPDSKMTPIEILPIYVM